MTWAALDDSWGDHPKVVALSPFARDMWARAFTRCARYLTDGFVCDQWVRELGASEDAEALGKTATAIAKELEAGGMWEKCDGGWMMHDYLKYNPSRAIVEKKREAARVRMNKARDKQGKFAGSSREHSENFTRSPSPSPSPSPSHSPTPTPTPTPAPPTSSAEPDETVRSAPDDPVVLTIQATDREEPWPLTEPVATAWADTYPGVDILAECKRARAWLDANPTRRKTHRGMKRFLVNWLARAQDSCNGSQASRGAAEPAGYAGLRAFMASERNPER